jgi:hypothetical protein
LCILKNIKTPSQRISALSRALCCGAAALLLSQVSTFAAQLPVNLKTAGNYTVLAKSGISTVPPSSITGDIGVSPIDSTAITGFSLIMDSSTRFSTSPQVVGRVYAANYGTPTPSLLTTAVGDMETAYTDAAGRTTPDFTERGAGNIGGLTLTPGLYKWGTGVNIPADVTLAGGPNDVWIFQIAGSVTVATSKSVILSGGAQARNIFWQVAGGVGVDIGAQAHFEGIVLTKAGINMKTGASINGRLYSQTAVTLQSNPVIRPAAEAPAGRLQFGPVSRASNGTVTLILTNTPMLQVTIQQSKDLVNWTQLEKPTPTVSPYVTSDATTPAETRTFYRAFYP